MNLVFEEEIRHTEHFGIHWVLMGFGWAPEGWHLEVIWWTSSRCARKY